MQFDKDHRGFSFSKEGPLDMRMNPETTVTAKEIVNRASEKELGTIFREYGEERHWRKAAHAIVEERRRKKFETTTELAAFLVSIFGFRGKGKLHPATLIFQALRIAVNRELEVIEKALHKVLQLLAPGGRVGVLSFHSLEDRIVKNVFKAAAERKKGEPSPALLKLLTKKPVAPSSYEIRMNPRSRSAKLRFAERI